MWLHRDETALSDANRSVPGWDHILDLQPFWKFCKGSSGFRSGSELQPIYMISDLIQMKGLGLGPEPVGTSIIIICLDLGHHSI